MKTPSSSFVVERLPIGYQDRISLSVILPTYNESETIKDLLLQLAALLDESFGVKYEIIVVDDDSPDHTWEISGLVALECPRVRVVRRRNERGLASAVIRGWQVAHGDVLAVMDADNQHPPTVLPHLFETIQEGHDLAVASRHVKGGGVGKWSLHRRVLSACARVVTQLLLPKLATRIRDPMSGFFMVRRTQIEGIIFRPLGYKILMEVLGRGRIRCVQEVPYSFCERKRGRSKVSIKVYIQFIHHLLRLRLSDLRFVRFAAIGLTGVVVDMSVLFLLGDASTLGWPLNRSKIAAGQAAIINNFIWNDLYTFSDIVGDRRAFGYRLTRFLKFEAICLSGLCLNIFLLNAQVNFFAANRYVANAIAIVLVTAWNYLVNRAITWSDQARAS